MDFFETIRERHSTRAYRSRAVDADVLRKILDTLNRAPSAGNLQAYEVYLITDEGQKTALSEAASDQGFLAQAPVILVFCAHAARSMGRYGKRGMELYCIQDATIACTFAMLAASAQGLSSVWIGAFEEGDIRRIIRAPQAHRPVAMLPIGYANESPSKTTRRALQDLVHRN